MGTVYVAFDPQLDRRVAVKVLRADRARSTTAEVYHQRLQREAKTLAQLDHPNIVRVYDVGFVGQQMFVAMELLEGNSLRRWLSATPRSIEVVLEVFEATARALATAHDAGIVHRDFKPDNVVVCSDGRPVVVDFGIARGADLEPVGAEAHADARDDASWAASEPVLTNPGRAMGTPAYMAPEQHAGEPLDGRSDQYSWAVSLWEALGGARPFGGRHTTLVQNKLDMVIAEPEGVKALPRWLVPVLRRAVAPRMNDRFASMLDVIAAIGAARPRRRSWQRLGLAVGAAVLAGVGVVAVVVGGDDDRCRTGEQQLAEIWNAQSQAAITARFQDSGIAYAPGTWALLQPRIDDYTELWADRWRSSCAAATNGDRASQRELICLNGRLETLAARLDVLASATAVTIENSTRIVGDIPGPEGCTGAVREPNLADVDGVTRDQVTTTRITLATVEALELAGRYAEGLELGRRALDDATRTGYAPVQAEALFLVGRMYKALGRYDEAARDLTDAAWTAMASSHDEVAARAMTDLVVVVGRELGDPPAGYLWANNAEAVIASAGGDELLEAGLLSNLALLQFREGGVDEARRGDELALEIRVRLLGDAHPLVAASHNNLGSDLWMLGRYAEAEAQLREAIEVHEAVAGPDHPRLAASLDNLGALLAERGDHAQARPLIERALQIREQSLAVDHPSLADTLINLGALQVALGDDDAAAGLFERARDIIERGVGPDHPTMATCLSNLGGVQLSRHRYDAALATFTRAADIYERSLGPNHAKVGLTLANLGEAQRLRGDLGAAEQTLSRSMRIVQDALGRDHPRLAFPIGRLGLTLLAHGQPARAIELLERALALGTDVEVVRGQRGELYFALARATLEAGGGLDRARGYAVQAREFTTSTTALKDLDRWLARLPRPSE